MRLLTSAATVLGVAAATVIVPVLPTGASAAPVDPVVRTESIPAPAGGPAPASTPTVSPEPSPSASAATPTTSPSAAPGSDVPSTMRASGSVTGTGRVAARLSKPRTSRFDVLGVTFDGSAPAGTQVVARVKADGEWGAWTPLPIEDGGPDAGTAEARRARTGTAPMPAAGAEGVEVEVTSSSGAAPKGLELTMVDGKRAAADSASGPANSAGAAVLQPTIKTRAQWGANESLKNCEPDPSDGYVAAVVHHTAGTNTYSAAEAPGVVRGILAYHTSSLGWCDLGYNFLVDRYGTIYEGRSGSLTSSPIGAHAGGFNSRTLGVSVMGDFSSVAAPAAATSAVAKVIAWKAAVSGFDPKTSTQLTSAGNPTYPSGTVVTRPRVTSHRDVYPTSCPGNSLYAQLAGIRSSAASIWTAGGGTAVRTMAASPQVESYTAPADGSIEFSGRGSGHGRGMSQWGAYGAATQGRTATQIADFYYPGTSVGTIGNRNINVRLDALGTAGTTAMAQPGLALLDGRTSTTLLDSRKWRIIPDGAGLTLQWSTATGWASSGLWKQWTGPLTFASRYGTVRVAQGSGARDYRGQIGTVRQGAGAISVNYVTMENYLRSVVPAEMPASWPAAALQAQAMAARTYGARERDAARAARRAYDTCDSTSCQVYRGSAAYSSTGALSANHEFAATTAAVTATAAKGRLSGGTPAFTEFHASSGSYTAAGSFPYLTAHSDPYDAVVTTGGNPNRWAASIATSTLQGKYPAIGTLARIEVLGRQGVSDWGARTGSVRLVGSTGSVTLTGPQFRSAAGLKSEWWTITSPATSQPKAPPKDLDANGLPDMFAVASDGTGRILSATGQGGFTARPATAGWSGMSLLTAAGAFDNDGRGDLLARDSAGTLWLYRGGQSALSAGRTAVASGMGGYTQLLATGDFDGDRLNDLVGRRSDGAMILMSGNGAGGIKAQRQVAYGWGGVAHAVAAGDLSGDGRPDLAAVYSDGSIRVYPGTGTGGLGSTFLMSGPAITGMDTLTGIGDLTGDGRADLVGRRTSDGMTLVWPVTGSGALGSPLGFGATAKGFVTLSR